MASKNTPAGKLIFTATQGSNDAFVEAEVETGLNQVGSGAKIAYRILEVGVRLSVLPQTNGAQMEFTLTRQSQASIPTLSERSLIWAFTRYATLTTSGANFQEQIIRWQPVDAANVIIVENPLYVQLDSASTSASNSAVGYILYEQVSITEVERLALIAQSLGS